MELDVPFIQISEITKPIAAKASWLMPGDASPHSDDQADGWTAQRRASKDVLTD